MHCPGRANAAKPLLSVSTEENKFTSDKKKRGFGVGFKMEPIADLPKSKCQEQTSRPTVDQALPNLDEESGADCTSNSNQLDMP